MSTVVNQDHGDYGCLALQYCEKRLPLTVLKTRAFYIGTADLEGFPCSRESVEYFQTEAMAQTALDTCNWTQRQHP